MGVLEGQERRKEFRMIIRITELNKNILLPSNLKWDKRFLTLAKHVAKWSKDPSTQVGAVIADKDNRIVSVGYNGFPKGVDDSEERYEDREQKYSLIVHAEINAILFAQKGLKNTTLYTWPICPCERCAGFIIQSGLKNIVSIEPISEGLRDRWASSFSQAERMFEESSVNMRIYGAAVWQGL